MLATSGGEVMKLRRQLKTGEKRVSLLIKPSGFEYRFEGELWGGRDVRNGMKLLVRAFKMHKHSLVKSVLAQTAEAKETKEKNNGDK